MITLDQVDKELSLLMGLLTLIANSVRDANKSPRPSRVCANLRLTYCLIDLAKRSVKMIC